MRRFGEDTRHVPGDHWGPSILNRGTSEGCVWRKDDLAADTWLTPVSAPVLDELDVLAEQLTGYRGRIEDLRAEDFSLSATEAVMAQVKQNVLHGRGFAVLDRLPVERWGDATSKAVVLLLTGFLGSVVMQKWDGTRLYEVKDSGKSLGYGVRRSITNLRQDFHTDGGWLTAAPEVVTLACLRPAQAGGASRVVSLATVHNILRHEQHELLSRLYEDFWWDRQAEHAPEAPRCSRHPVFRWSGGRSFVARCYNDYIVNGHHIMGEPLDSIGQAALAALEAAIQHPGLALEFQLEAGQIEFVNNHLLAHSRTAFDDDTEAGPGRLLLRLWTRSGPDFGLEGVASAAND